jgi:iron complex outermembrane receptor protein
MTTSRRLIDCHRTARIPVHLPSSSVAKPGRRGFRVQPAWAAIAALCGAVQAQTTPASDPALAATQTVTITGQGLAAPAVGVGAFRDRDPLDVPLANAVITRELIEAQNARSAYEVLRNTAGITRHQLSGSVYDNVAIRGILIENRGNYRLNGALPIINLTAIPIENKERVEVLKGASSFYYGMVPPAGVVNYVTKRAGLKPVTSLTLYANDHGAAQAHLDIGRRFGSEGEFGLRANVAGGNDHIGLDRYQARRNMASLSADWRVNEVLSLSADLEHYHKRATEQPPLRLPAASNGVISLPAAPQGSQNLGSAWMTSDATATNALLRADLQLSDALSLLLETGHAELERDRNFAEFVFSNQATGAGNLAFSLTRGQRYTNRNHRAELAGTWTTGTLQHEWLLGLSHNFRTQNPGNTQSASRPQNFANPVDIAEITPTFGANGARSTIRDQGIYLHDRIGWGPWQALLGVRWSDYESGTDGAPAQTIAVTKTSPTASLIYKVSPTLMVYGSALEGLEVTRPVPANASNAGETLPPALSRQKELGLKARLSPTAQAQAALFEYTGLPVVGFVAGPGSRFDIVGNSRVRGLELSAQGDWRKVWGFSASAVWLDAEVRRALQAAEVGRTPAGVPRSTASAFVERRWPGALGLAVNAGVEYIGKRPVNNLNQASVAGVGVFSLGARLQHRWAGTDLRWQINLENAADKAYWAAASGGYLSPGAPRTLRLQVKASL